MKLIGSGTSPFVRKVRVLIIETGLADKVEVEAFVTSPKATNPTVRGANPLGKVPALVRNDGPAIYDSRVITRFLDAQAGAGLYPEARLWETLTLEATADGIHDAAVAMVYEKRLRPEDKVWDEWPEMQWQKVASALDVINERWMSHLAGPFDMSHIAVGCALSYLDFRHGERQWRTGRDGLAKWFETFAQRESMRATEPE